MVHVQVACSSTEIGYENGRALMAKGAQALAELISSKLETAMGKSMPQMELRFKDLSVTANVVIASGKNHKSELPTIANHIKKSFMKCSRKRHVVRKEILKPMSGVFRPGTITLVLGQPGSGKSALMEILSGRFPLDKTIKVDGQITYNGQEQKSLLKRLPQFVGYVTQRDRHFPTLTVKETFQFAHECSDGGVLQRVEKQLTQGTPEENKAAAAAARAIFEHHPDIIIQALGLEKCQDTVVGDALLRGVSGGERKRVTTGEMEFGMKLTTFMDEISTGLDSAATFDIVRTHGSLAKHLRKTVVIALLQPPPEVFALFDDVLILNDGHIMYHGPRVTLLDYFGELGFVCPPRRDVADFLLDLGTSQQNQYEVDLPSHRSHPRTAREFAERFVESEIYQKTLTHLNQPWDPVVLRDAAIHMDPIPAFRQSAWASTMTLIRRQIKITVRNRAFLRGRAVMVIVMGLLYATTFYKFNELNVQVVMGVIFSSALFLALGQSSQIATFMAAREVFYKQRGANFYRTSSYVISFSATQIPLAFLESLAFGSLIYWLCGFVPTASNFVIYILILILTNLAFAAWFFFVSSIAHDLHVAKPMAMVSVLFFILFAGFVVAKKNIPDYVIWIYWINPIAWCVRSLAVNQYRSDRFEGCQYKDTGANYCMLTNKTVGEFLLSQFDVPSEKEWVGFGILYMAFAYVVFMTMACLALEYRRYESPENVTAGNSDAGDDKPAPVRVATAKVVPVQPQQGRSNHFTPVTLAFKDLWYTVPDPSNPKETIDLLKGVSGIAKSGTMTALMGSSGAGKTTLMDVIAGRKTGGHIRGQIMLNGHEASHLTVRRATGYCEQMDLHSEAATFREALTFSAFLRQSSDVPDDEKHASVKECLDLLDLHPIADQIIRGSSVEQMKRLTIGVELAAQPSVIFLDEPTSGLDAQSAKVIMNGVRKVANAGRTILCTIHQPSFEVFALFDSLLLLKRGGETVFFGELGTKCSRLIQYFETIKGVAKLEDGYNPATWMLEVIGAGVGNKNGQQTDFVSEFRNSEQQKQLDNEMDQEGVSRPSPSLPPLKFTSKRAASNISQMKMLLSRFASMYWRTPSYNWTRIVISFILGVLFGLVFIKANYKTFQGINGGVGMMFMTMTFIGIISFNSVLPLAAEERASYYRERASQTYNAFWYFLGTTLIEIPYVFVSALVFVAVYFPMVGFTGVDRFFTYWLVIGLHILVQTYMGQFMSYATPNVEVAAIIGTLLNSIFLLFMGFNPPTSQIPASYKWVHDITPHRYTLSILGSLMFGQCKDGTEFGCRQLTNMAPQYNGWTAKQYVEGVFDMHADNITRDIGILVVFIVAFRILALLALSYLNFQKR